MQDQNKKLLRWILGGGLICFLLSIPGVLIVKLITRNNREAYESYAMIMIWILLSIYVIISVVKVVQYAKFAKKYESEKVEKVSKELTTEFKQVLLNYSEPISKDLFKCQARIDDDGKIVCKIQLDYEVKIESYEEFLRHFRFNQD